jgi:hypothetical protein
MGVMSFQLPADVPADLREELGRSCIAGGHDTMPWPTEARVDDGRLSVRREAEESGFLLAPWDIPGFGRLMGMTGTLIERGESYPFLLELARGKLNQLRGQAADWEAAGLRVPPDLAQEIQDVNRAFSHAVSQSGPAKDPLAGRALELSYRAARRLVGLYVEQMFQVRHQRQSRLDAALGCRLGGRALAADPACLFRESFSEVGVTFAWNEVEPTEGIYHWRVFEAQLDWAQAAGLGVAAGPLIDFSPGKLPDWLWLWRGDLSGVANFMCDYVTAAIRRFAGTVRYWQLCAASNYGTVLGMGEDELLLLTARLVEAARQADPRLELAVGVTQPWGEYMAREDRTHSPFVFADTLIRAGLNLAALDLEVVMGVRPRGSYFRDLLELSRLIDLYSLLGVPLRLTLGCPSSAEPDSLADHELGVPAGFARSGWDPAAQAEWTAACGALALCRPYVRGVQWVHWSDAEPHQFPRCGLLDAHGVAKPALRQVANLRAAHLR